MAKKTKKVEMKVAEYIDHIYATEDIRLTCKDVYKMIKDGVLKAYKGPKNAWIIQLEIKVGSCKAKEKEEIKEYTVKEYAELKGMTVKKVRQFISDGKINAEKVSGKYIIKECVRRHK